MKFELHDAARQGDVDRILELTSKNGNYRLDPNMKDRGGNTPLHHAAASDQCDAILCLLKCGTNINAQNNQLETPLHKAVAKGRLRATECLVTNGANVTIQNSKKKTPYEIATTNDIKKIFSVSSTVIVPLPKKTKVSFVKPVIKHIEQNNPFVKNTINTTLKENLANYRNYQVFKNGFFNAIKERILSFPFFQSKKLEISKISKKNRDLIELQVLQQQRKEKQKQLKNKLFRFLEACYQGELAKVKVLLDIGSDLTANAKNSIGWSGIHLAAQNGQIAVVQYLVQICGVSINEPTDEEHWTPLMLTASDFFLSSFQFMVEKLHADVTLKSKNNETVLDRAYANGQQLIVDYLLGKTNIDPLSKTFDGKLPYDLTNNEQIKTSLIFKMLSRIEILAAKEQPDVILAYYDDILQRSENCILALLEKGKLLARQKHYQQATTCFLKVTKLEQQNVNAWYWNGLNYYEQDNDNALECFLTTMELDNHHFNALRHAVEIYRKKNELSKALKLINEFLINNPHHIEAMQEKILLLINDRKLNAALLYVELIISEHEDLLLFYQLKLQLLIANEQYKAAFSYFSKLSEEYRQDVKLHILYAYLFLLDDRAIAAKSEFEKLLINFQIIELVQQGAILSQLKINKSKTELLQFIPLNMEATKDPVLLSLLYFYQGQVYIAWEFSAQALNCFNKVLQQKVDPITQTFTKFYLDKLNRTTRSEKKQSLISKIHQIDESDILMQSKIGKGGYGDVFKSIWKTTTVAVKQLQGNYLVSEHSIKFNHEVNMMLDLQHPNIISVYGISIIENNFSIIMEYMPDGSLQELLISKAEISWQDREKIAFDITKGLAYIHERQVLHRDLKSGNILLQKVNGEYVAKIADFGLAKITRGVDTSSGNASHCGTRRWTAPEILLERAKHSPASDAYSYGVVLWEIVTRKIPEEYQHITVSEECQNYSWILSKIIPECVKVEPTERLSIYRALTIFKEQQQSDNNNNQVYVAEHLSAQPPVRDFTKSYNI